MAVEKIDLFKPLNSIVVGLNNNKTLQIEYGNTSTFHNVKSIHLTAKPPYIILDDEADTRININQIKDSKFI